MRRVGGPAQSAQRTPDALADARWDAGPRRQTTHDFGSHSVPATNYRVRVPGPLGEDVWLVTVNKELGTVRAKQESGDQLEWSLVRTDVEVKVGNAKLMCRDYDFKSDPPVELKALVIQKRRMCLSAEVPGRVVRQSYSGFLGATWKVDLISFRR